MWHRQGDVRHRSGSRWSDSQQAAQLRHPRPHLRLDVHPEYPGSAGALPETRMRSTISHKFRSQCLFSADEQPRLGPTCWPVPTSLSLMASIRHGRVNVS